MVLTQAKADLNSTPCSNGVPILLTSECIITNHPWSVTCIVTRSYIHNHSHVVCVHSLILALHCFYCFIELEYSQIYCLFGSYGYARNIYISGDIGPLLILCQLKKLFVVRIHWICRSVTAQWTALGLTNTCGEWALCKKRGQSQCRSEIRTIFMC